MLQSTVLIQRDHVRCGGVIFAAIRAGKDLGIRLQQGDVLRPGRPCSVHRLDVWPCRPVGYRAQCRDRHCDTEWFGRRSLLRPCRSIARLLCRGRFEQRGTHGHARRHRVHDLLRHENDRRNPAEKSGIHRHPNRLGGWCMVGRRKGLLLRQQPQWWIGWSVPELPGQSFGLYGDHRLPEHELHLDEHRQRPDLHDRCSDGRFDVHHSAVSC